MDITLKKPLPDNPRNVLRRAGYSEHYDPRAQKTSYAIRLGSGRYPRFHCYYKETDTTVSFSLHIDQKEASYEGADHMHSGEYDGKLVEDEMGRIRRWAAAPGEGGSSNDTPRRAVPIAQRMDEEARPTLPSSRPPKKLGFFERVFGRKTEEEE